VVIVSGQGGLGKGCSRHVTKQVGELVVALG
jgi:hypothetical protein